MIDPKKLQYYTMAHRMRGFAEGLDALVLEEDHAFVHLGPPC